MPNRKFKPIQHIEYVIDQAEENLARVELIRKFQRIEGNIDCCASAYSRACNQIECLWRDDCKMMGCA